MKTWMWIAGMSLLSLHAFAEDDCEDLSRQVDDLTKALKDYKPPIPAQGTDSGQRNGQGTHSGNANNAVNSANTCANQVNAIAKQFDELLTKLKDNNCPKPPTKKAEKGKKDATMQAGHCAAAGKEAAAQGEKSAENKDKMGEKDKGGGSGGGGMPQLPQMPQQKKDNSPDPVKAEAARQARITACKNAANNTLNSRKAGCEATYNYNPKYPVANVLQMQNECKQNAIFASQTDQNNCDAANPPGTTSSLAVPSDNFNPNSAATASTISTTH